MRSTQTAQQTTQQINTTSGENITLAGIHSITYNDPRDQFLGNLQRDLSPNAPYLITDYLIDAEGQVLLTTDPRGIKTLELYDVLGRTVREFTAVTEQEEQLSETDYDDASNVIEIRHPRHFSEVDGNNDPIRAVETFTWNGRNLQASHTIADGDANLEATESWTYYLDGRKKSHTDFRGNSNLIQWHVCCGRLQAIVQRDGQSTSISNTDFNGNITHTAVVKVDPSVGGTVAPNWHDPSDADTIQETTTRFDGLNRPQFQTKWQTALGEVDDDARANLGTGDIPISNDPVVGLTTIMSYDEDLTDGVGIDAAYPAQFAELATRGVTFGPDADGFASAVTNPEGESSITVQDGLGRKVMMIDGEGNITTFHFDEIVPAANITAHPDIPIPGSLVKTTRIDANGNSSSVLESSMGTLARVDGLGNYVSQAAFDANGNAVITRDANGLGENCTFDKRNLKVACADLQEQLEGNQRTWTYNAHNAVLTSTDAEGHTESNEYDVRDRLTSGTDRNNLSTVYGFDDNNNLVSLTDPRNNTRTWSYDARNLKIEKQYPDGVADRCLYENDALGRQTKKTQQDDTEIRYVFDLAGRMTRTHLSPSGWRSRIDRYFYLRCRVPGHRNGQRPLQHPNCPHIRR